MGIEGTNIRRLTKERVREMSGVIGEKELCAFEWDEEKRSHEEGTCHELPYSCPLCTMDETLEIFGEQESQKLFSKDF